MKKIIVLVVAMTLLAGSAFALSVKNSKHDLSINNTTTEEVCVFCHTPHNANQDVSIAPLWNRGVTNSTGNVYSSDTFNATPSLTTVNLTDAPLCLSCHAATGALTGALENAPNTAPGAAGGVTAQVVGNAIIGTDLSNDHPIGFAYTDAGGSTGGMVVSPAAPINLVGGDMWCSSCHDVHDNANGTFLVMNNAGSNLCLACHDK